MRVFAVGNELSPSAFLFNNGSRTALFEFWQQHELDELSLLVAGMLDAPSSERLRVFIDDNYDMFEAVDDATARAFLQSPQSRQLSYYACVGSVESALLCLRRLEEARVWIVGVGGIGCHIADHLVRIGVRKFVLIDFDVVEESNLNRQVLYRTDDVGRFKVEAAASRLRDIRSEPLDILCYRTFKSDLLLASHADRPAMIFVSADAMPFELRRQVIPAAFHLGVPYAFLGYVGENAAIAPMVLDRSGGCGSCATAGGKPEEWLWPLARHKALDIPPSSYATNAIVAAAAVDLWTRHLIDGLGGAFDVKVSMRDYSVQKNAAERDPTCPVCGPR